MSKDIIEDFKETFGDVLNVFNQRYLKATLVFMMLNGLMTLIPVFLFGQLTILGFISGFVAANLASIIWILIIQLENKRKEKENE